MNMLIRHLRVLPALIGLASLLLVVKLGSVYVGVEDAMRAAFSVANAAEPGSSATLRIETAKGDAAASDDETGEGSPAADGEAAAGPAEGAPMVNGAPPPSAAPESPLSDAELEVLQQLTNRRKELEAREDEMEQRSVLLQAAELRIDQKIENLKSLQTTLEELTALRDEQEEMKIGSLVKIYENMKPKEAARIFEELEMDTLLLVADRMKERKLAAIMADMNPAKAKDITVELARLRQLPDQLLNAEG